MAQTKTGKARLGPWGVELTAMDKSIQPGDDFFRYAGGAWMKATQIPADRARWGAFSILGAQSEDDVRAALDEAARGKHAAGSASQKAVDYYRSYLDTTAIDARG
ncbi:MAG TPA: M13 family metallopeptidase N-terminal domain-containing protein, partial [Candidatus Krumholzibacteria bacterium]|nr:M13 family metallopeptidase N-terminal domain-containing protein [Candidatus Krumholzibacteria bacterium]